MSYKEFHPFDLESIQVKFKCDNCGKEILSDFISVPPPDHEAESNSESYNSNDELITCEYCDKDFFINLYRLELRKKERDIGKTMVGIVTVSAYDLREISEEESVKIVEDIGPVVDKYMRKYDVITKLNKNQFAFMMFNSSEEMIKRINQRMNFLLNQVKKKHRILFTLSCKPIQATDENYNETAF